MNINETNKQRIHDVLITDLQKRLFKQHELYIKTHNITDNDFDSQLSMLVDSVLHTETLADVNDVLIEYGDLFMDYDSINVFTLEGTMNYMLDLLIKQTELLKCNC